MGGTKEKGNFVRCFNKCAPYFLIPMGWNFHCITLMSYYNYSDALQLLDGPRLIFTNIKTILLIQNEI